MKWLFIIWLILVAILICVRMQVNVQWPAITAQAQAPTATPTPLGATCTITGRVFNPDTTPLANGTVQFNSVVQQTLQGGAVIPPTFKSTNTDANGNLSPAMAIAQGLQGQFTFCSPSAGGCGNPTPVLIPIASTADISSILIGIQLSSGGNVVASALDVTGNATIGGSLQVTGPTTLTSLNVTGPATFNSTAIFSGSSCFADNGCWNNTGIVNVTHVGIGQWPALDGGLLQAGETAIDSSTFPDALGTNVNMNYASGVHYNSMGQWIADVTYPMIFNQVSNASNGPEHAFFVYGPQTIGQPFSTANRVQYMAVRANVPGVAAGLYLESGGIDVINGGISANGGALGNGIWSSYAQNGPTYVQSYNGDNADSGSVAVLRASNGLFVTDLGQTGGNANLGGFFSPNRGYVASNAVEGLLLEATGAGAGAELYLSAPNANKIRVIGNGHFMSGTDGYAPPTVGACGGGGGSHFATNTDMSGWIMTGSTATTSCLMTFGAAWPSTPQCFCNVEALTWCQVTPSTSGISMNFGTPLAGTWVDYWCTGNE